MKRRKLTELGFAIGSNEHINHMAHIDLVRKYHESIDKIALLEKHIATLEKLVALLESKGGAA